MDFGTEHNAAINVRLKKFFFQTLRSRRLARVQDFLWPNAMNCIVLVCGIAQTPEGELPPPMPGTSSQPDDFDEKEREGIKASELEETDSEKKDNAHEEQDMNTQDIDEQ